MNASRLGNNWAKRKVWPYISRSMTMRPDSQSHSGFTMAPCLQIPVVSLRYTFLAAYPEPSAYSTGIDNKCSTLPDCKRAAVAESAMYFFFCLPFSFPSSTDVLLYTNISTREEVLAYVYGQYVWGTPSRKYLFQAEMHQSVYVRWLIAHLTLSCVSIFCQQSESMLVTTSIFKCWTRIRVTVTWSRVEGKCHVLVCQALLLCAKFLHPCRPHSS